MGIVLYSYRSILFHYLYFVLIVKGKRLNFYLWKDDFIFRKSYLNVLEP